MTILAPRISQRKNYHCALHSSRILVLTNDLRATGLSPRTCGTLFNER